MTQQETAKKIHARPRRKRTTTASIAPSGPSPFDIVAEPELLLSDDLSGQLRADRDLTLISK